MLSSSGKTDVDVQEIDLQRGDLLILCSDGLSDLVQEQELMEMVLGASGDLNRACRDLTQLANQRGGKDNITALIIHIE